jgi:hypothetical protein
MEECATSAREALSLLPTVDDKLAKLAWPVLSDATDLLRLTGQLKDAAAAGKRALFAAEAAEGAESPATASVGNALAAVLDHLGEFTGAKVLIEKSIEWGEAQPQRDERTLSVWRETHATILNDLMEFVRVEEEVQKSMGWVTKQHPIDGRAWAPSVRSSGRSSGRTGSDPLANNRDSRRTLACTVGPNRRDRPELGWQRQGSSPTGLFHPRSALTPPQYGRQSAAGPRCASEGAVHSPSNMRTHSEYGPR